MIKKIKDNPEKYIYWLLFIIFILSMLPVWYLARYTVPSLDDYGFGAVTHDAWLETHSVWQMIKASAEYVKFYFFAKQATYSSVFLMCLFPGVISEGFYKITPFIMTGMLIGSLSALIHVLVRDCMGVKDRYTSGSLNLLVLFVAVQTMIAPLEGIYWYNGATHYVFMQSVMYFEVALILHSINIKPGVKRTICIVISCLLGIVVGGGNLITGLQASILSVLFMLLLILQKVSEKKKYGILNSLSLGKFDKNNLILILPLLFTLAGYIINITAPGNYKRAGVEVQMNPVKAVLCSFEWGAIYAVSWTKPIVIAAFAVIIVMVWKLAGKSSKNYIHPVLCGVLSYCVFSAMLTPTFFATSADAPNRVKNIIGTALYIFFLVNIINDFGYLRTGRGRVNGKEAPKGIVLTKIMNLTMEKYGTAVITGIVAVMMIFLLQSDKNEFTSISAVRSILNGEAQRYYEQSVERINTYNTPDKDITVHKLTDDARPYLLFKEDLGNDGEEGYWQIVQICDYYDKDSITVTE